MFISPAYRVLRIPVEQIEANDYNPNRVASREMRILYTSIKHDGYTMPIVCYYDGERDKYIIVDGFHRYTIIKKHKDIYEREGGCLPVSVIDKPIQERMKSTQRHNMGRGTHPAELQAELIKLLKSYCDEVEIMEDLGLTYDEVVRLLRLRDIKSELVGVEYTKEAKIVRD